MNYGCSDFMDQMTTSARSTDSGLGNYPVNVMNGGSENEHQRAHAVSCVCKTETTQLWGRNVLLKEGRAGGPLVPLDCPHMSSSLSFPARSVAGVDLCFRASFFLVIHHRRCQSESPLTSRASESRASTAIRTKRRVNSEHDDPRS